MRTVLFELGGLPVPSYGFALALAFTAGIALAYVRARRAGLDPLPVLDAGLVILAASMVGSRLLFLATRSESDAATTSAIGAGLAGLSMQGGVVLAVAAVLALLRWRRLPALAYCDLLAPSVALGEAITRVGCLLNGCCSGRPSDLPWAIARRGDDFARLHPAQIYTSLGSLLLFVGLLRLARHAPPRGGVFGAWLCGAGALRIVLDPLRAYDAGELVEVLGRVATVHQLVALLLVVAGVALLATSSRTALGARLPPSSRARLRPLRWPRARVQERSQLPASESRPDALSARQSSDLGVR